MLLDSYRKSYALIQRTYLKDRKRAFRLYCRLAAIFIQDSQADIGQPYYGNTIINKGKLMFEVQELFIFDL